MKKLEIEIAVRKKKEKRCYLLRKSGFRADVRRAYDMIVQNGIIDDAELQYRLNVGLGTFYRIKKALLAIYDDIEWENGFFKVKDFEKSKEKAKHLQIEYWGELEPQSSNKNE